ncbi:MAG TPA: MalY/PatB family protein [Gaiellaceae bacterium]|nr:MalY/PatB family protein [Gaiellaceae bacterium]
MPAAFDDLSLDELRARRSAKWATYPADVLPAWVAEMDFALAGPVRAALQAALDRDDCGYPYPDTLGQAFAGFAARRFGWPVEPANAWLAADVVVGIAEALRLLTAPGEGVVITPPVYPPFFATIREIGRAVAEAPLATAAGGCELDLDRLERAFAAGARTLLLCNPHNPTGRVFSRLELERLATLAERHGVAVVADEIHAPLTLPGTAFTPFATLGLSRTVTITSASKAWNLAGLKCAVVVPEAGLRDELAPLAQTLRYHAGHLGVLASIAAFEEGEPWLDELVAYLDGNRRIVGELLAALLPQVRYLPPDAGYLAWLDCRALGLGDDPSQAFLERGRVALSPGPAFGSEGRGFARLNFGTSRAILTDAIARLASAVESDRE